MRLHDIPKEKEKSRVLSNNLYHLSEMPLNILGYPQETSSYYSRLINAFYGGRRQERAAFRISDVPSWRISDVPLWISDEISYVRTQVRH